MSGSPLFSTDAFLWGLAAVCQLHRQPFAPNLVLQQFPPPHRLASLQEAAQALKLKSGIRSVPASEFHALPQAFLAVLRPDATAASAETAHDPESARSAPKPNRLAVVLRCDAERILYATHSSPAPVTATLKEFDAQYAGTVVLCVREPVKLAEVAAEADAAVLYGGHGTVAAMLLAGVPVALFPMHVEQALVARNVVRMGAGIVVGPQSSVPELPRAVTSVLGETRFAARAKAFAEKYASFSPRDAVAQTAHRIEQLCEGRTGSPRTRV